MLKPNDTELRQPSHCLWLFTDVDHITLLRNKKPGSNLKHSRRLYV